MENIFVWFVDKNKTLINTRGTFGDWKT